MADTYIGFTNAVDQLQTQADTIAPGFNEKVAQAAAPGEDYITTAQRIMTAVTMTYQQQQLMSLNIERAKQGLPPLDIAQYTGVGVNIGLSPATQQLVMVLGLGLLGILFLGRRR
jgi:hypothetical protein